jgi:PilZ domain
MATATLPAASTAITGPLPVTTLSAAQQEHAIIVCAQCGTTTAMPVADYAARYTVLKVTCSCGYRFAVLIEARQCSRKPVCLDGEYIRGRSWEPMGVEEMSRGGIGFRAEHSHTLQVGERVIVHVRLDDPQRSMLSALVEIRRIEGLRVGAAFVDVGDSMATHHIVGFYFMG